MTNLVASLAPGGAILLIEPDFLPVSIAEPAEVHRFWEGWLQWSREQGSTTSSAERSPDGSPRRASTASTAPRKRPSTKAVRPGPPTGSTRSPSSAAAWSRSGTLDDETVDRFLAQCDDPSWWTQTIAFTAVHGRSATPAS